MENKKLVVGVWGEASEVVRADIAAAREVVRDYADVRLYVCERSGEVYVSLPGSYLMTGFFNPLSGGCLALANRRCYWHDVYGGGLAGRWSDWVGLAYADCAMGGKVLGLGDGGIDSVSWLTGLGAGTSSAVAKIVLLHSGFDGSEYLLRIDAWDEVAESVGALGEYPCLNDEYFSAAEHEFIWDYVSEVVVAGGLAEGVAVDDLAAWDRAMCGVLHDLDSAYRFMSGPDLSVDDSSAKNRDGWKRAITLGAIAWVRGGCSRADVIAAAEWAGAADGDGHHYGRFVMDDDIGTRWGASGVAGGAEAPDYFSFRSWAALLADV